MLAIVHSVAVLGIESIPITIEVDASNGLPGFCLVGLPDSVVKESRDRVFSALKNSGFIVPNQRITVNLAPADIKKEGSFLDLPIAVGILLATGQLEYANIEESILVGELSLEGTLKPVKNTLSVALFTKKNKLKGLVLPHANLPEAQIVTELSLYPAHSLREVVEIILSPLPEAYVSLTSKLPLADQSYSVDFSDVKGQSQAIRACEIAAAGAHNFLFIGNPGCGKTLIAQRLPTILPQMNLDESIITTMIYSSAGLISGGHGVLSKRPFRSPHHTISHSALVGGGSYPKPGEVSLANNGVLFLDELPEFQKKVLETLRQPMEDGHVTIARASMTLSFPSLFMLGAAMNPCPCGYLMDPKKNCLCHPSEIKKYLSKISGPLLDRIDIQLELPTLNYDELSGAPNGESSASIRAKVSEARKLQEDRFKDYPHIHCNAHMSTREIRKFCELKDSAKSLLKKVVQTLGLSARAYDRILRMSRTVADLARDEHIRDEHLAEAIHYRSLDRTAKYLA